MDGAMMERSLSRRGLLRAGAGAAAALALADGAWPAAAGEPGGPSWGQPGAVRLPGWTGFGIRTVRSDQAVVAAYFFYWFHADFLRPQRRPFDPNPFHAVDQDTQSFRD